MQSRYRSAVETVLQEGAVYKDVRSRVYVYCGHFENKEVLQMQLSKLFLRKNLIFFENYGVSARTKIKDRVELVRTFFGQRRKRRSIFRNFARMSFMKGS